MLPRKPTVDLHILFGSYISVESIKYMKKHMLFEKQMK
jgi:hypothetical protein